MKNITPCLWFDNNAEEAVRFYMDVFPDCEITQRTYSAGDIPQAEGSVLTISFRLGNDEFVALNGGSAFSFSEGVSLMVNCETQAEIDHYWDALTKDGSPMACGWLKDKYGLAWQIVPDKFFHMISSGDKEKTARVLNAMNTMIKFDIAGLEAAFNEE